MVNILCHSRIIRMVDEPRIVEIDMPDLVIFIPKTPVLDFILFFFVQTLIFTVRNVDVQLGTSRINKLSLFQIFVGKKAYTVKWRPVQFVFNVDHNFIILQPNDMENRSKARLQVGGAEDFGLGPVLRNRIGGQTSLTIF